MSNPQDATPFVYHDLPNKEKPFLNLGCGKVTMPGVKPAHHALVPDSVYNPDLAWINVDINGGENIHQGDIFDFPYHWKDSQFGGALLSHIVEHIPHEIDFARKREWATQAYKSDLIDGGSFGQMKEDYTRLEELGDGFYIFFSELHRILAPGSIAHVLCPFAFSTGAFQDPTHRRYITPETFTYLVPNPDAPFELPQGGAWELVAWNFGWTPYGVNLLESHKNAYLEQHREDLKKVTIDLFTGKGEGGLLEAAQGRLEHEAMQAAMNHVLNTAQNAISDLYVALRVVK